MKLATLLLCVLPLFGQLRGNEILFNFLDPEPEPLGLNPEKRAAAIKQYKLFVSEFKWHARYDLDGLCTEKWKVVVEITSRKVEDDAQLIIVTTYLQQKQSVPKSKFFLVIKPSSNILQAAADAAHDVKKIVKPTPQPRAARLFNFITY